MKLFLTSSVGISKLVAHDRGIITIPAVVTDSAKLVIVAHLYAAFVGIGASNQLNLTILTGGGGINCMQSLAAMDCRDQWTNFKLGKG